MSYSPPGAGFFDTIQVYFLELTGRAIMFSGRDMELLCRWRDEGASAAIICRGIAEAARNMADGEPPRGVRSCQVWIEREIASARARASGGRAEEVAPAAQPTAPRDNAPAEAAPTVAASNPHEALLKSALARIESAGQACPEDGPRRVFRDAWRSTRALLDRDTLTDPYSELAAIEDALADGYYRALDLQKQQAIAQAIVAQDPGALALMSPAAREEHLAARRRSWLVREHGLPRLLE